MDYEVRSELMEVLADARDAKKALTAAENELKAACGWGVVDMIGGKFVVGAIKHAKMRKAAQLIREAQAAIEVLNDNLDDASGLQALDLRSGSFSGVTDLLFDNLVSDAVVQKRLTDALKAVRNAITVVDGIMEDIKAAIRA